MARKFGLKFSHSGQVLMHAMNAHGLFFPAFKAIGVSFKGGKDHGALTLSHEFAHLMDYYVGKQKSQYFASEKLGSIENQIASIFRKGMRARKTSEYYSRTCECFARAFEMYYYENKYKDEEFDEKENPSWEYYRANVRPLVEQFFDVNNDYLKSEIFDIVFSRKRERKIKNVA